MPRRHLQHGGLKGLRDATYGEMERADAHGKGHRWGGKMGLMKGLDLASAALHVIPGAEHALGLEDAPPPPPPRAGLHAVRTGIRTAARPRTLGRGHGHGHSHGHSHGRMEHSCPHCGCGKKSASHVTRHKCRMCGGSWSSFLSKAADVASKVASHPLAQHLMHAAAPHAMALAQKHAPGLVNAAHKAVSAYKAVNAHPLGHAAIGAVRQRAGMGHVMKHKHSCPHCGHGKKSASHVTRHKCRMCGGSWSSFLSKAADVASKVASHPVAQHLMHAAAPHVMALAQKHAPGLVNAAHNAVSAYKAVNAHPLGLAAIGAVRQRAGMGHYRRSRPPTAHSLAVKRVMAEHGMGLGHASRYVKEHGLAY